MLEYALRPSIMQELEVHLRGELICPNDQGYEAARKVWNGMIDKYPAAIVRCADVVDVVHAVQFARAHHLLVAVRSGGHSLWHRRRNWAGGLDSWRRLGLVHGQVRSNH